MEEDFVKASAQKEAEMDRLGIEYLWRDACVDLLIESRKCIQSDFKSYFPLISNLSICNEIQAEWRKCQTKREFALKDKLLE